MVADDKPAERKASEPEQAGRLLFGMEAYVEGLKEALDEHFEKVDKAQAEGTRIEPLVVGVGPVAPERMEIGALPASHPSERRMNSRTRFVEISGRVAVTRVALLSMLTRSLRSSP